MYQIFLGVFRVPVTGVWRISFSVETKVTYNDKNEVYIYHNQRKKDETRHYTYISHYHGVRYTGGRELFTRAKQGDTFHLGTQKADNGVHRIIACFEFVSL